MKISELLLPEFDAEIATTRRVLERTPDEKGDWKPHPKAFQIGHLAQLVSMLPGWTVMTLTKTELDIAPKDGPTRSYSLEKTSKLLEEFDKGAKAGREAVANAKEEDWNVPWTLKRAGKAVMTQPRYMIYRQFTMNHIVHHRAQLGLYLRMLDLKVPSMYGPTADDK